MTHKSANTDKTPQQQQSGDAKFGQQGDKSGQQHKSHSASTKPGASKTGSDAGLG